MKVALVTTPPSVRSGIGDYTRHLLPYLREHAVVDTYVAKGAGEDVCGEPCRDVRDLVPREYDQILYQLGNERSHAFMLPMIRSIGGTVMQHDWILFDLAMAAYPGLGRGGPKGHALALREGGVDQLRVYANNWLERRRSRRSPQRRHPVEGLRGTLLTGWHEPEEDGRWTSDHTTVRIPGEGVQRVVVELHVDRGRRVVFRRDGAVLAEATDGGEHALELGGADEPVLELETTGVRVTKEQRRAGDVRRLGVFVLRIAWEDEAGSHELDLGEPVAVRPEVVSLSRDRFRLPFNRSVVRFADAFIVHSRYVHDRILADRNARTAIGILHHGSERRWRDRDRAEIRRALGLDEPWTSSFLVTSFGGVQAHKRIDKALEALALARRERDDIRMVLAGSLHSDSFDPRAFVHRLGLDDAARFTGFVPEEEGWDWLEAGHVAMNLRGPTSGGTSGGIFQAFSMGRAVIASDAAEQRELPDSAVVKVPLGEGEVEGIARALVQLRDDREKLAELERGVRDFVDTECHWSVVAKQYADFLESFPPARVNKKSLIALRLAQAKSGAEGA